MARVPRTKAPGKRTAASVVACTTSSSSMQQQRRRHAATNQLRSLCVPHTHLMPTCRVLPTAL